MTDGLLTCASETGSAAGDRLAAQLRALADAGRALDVAEPLAHPARVAACLRDAFGYAAVTLYLLDEADRTLRPATGDGLERPVAAPADSLAARVAEQRRAARDGLAGGGATLAAPLVAGERLFGVLEVQCRPPDGSAESDLFVLQALADRVATAIEGARHRLLRAQTAEYLAETRRRLDEVSTLYLIAGEITSSLDLDEVLETIVDVVRRALKCRGCCIFLLDPAEQMLQIKAASGLKPEWREAVRLALGQGVAGRAAATVQPVYVPDTRACADYVVFDPEVRCLLAVPLQARGRVIGVLNIDAAEPDAFGPVQERLLNIAASQVAVAIDNACLYSEVVAEKQRKEEFLAVVSHEFRTPLACIRGYVNLMLEDEQLDARTQREFLEIVHRQTERFILLVNNLLHVAQLDGVDLQLSPRPLQLGDLVAVAVRKLHGLADEKSISLSADVAPELPLVNGDHNWLEQVISNLIHNAIKYTPAGGHVEVHAYPVECEVWLEVRDTGVGIPADALDKLFGKYYRVPDGIGLRPAGTGLGLHIARRVVEALGGRIWVESTLGAGSVFRFALPVRGT
jgi:signal transduction histidine kinase